MQICKRHWALVVQGVKDRGLWHLVPSSGEAAFENAVAPLLDPSAPTTFDPLTQAAMFFYSRGLELMGLEIMGENKNPAYGEDGHYCPLCCARASFDHHNTPTGRCGDAHCHLQVKPGDQPWDEHLMYDTLDRMLKHCQDTGLTTPTQ